jgi:diacylglycerol kinase (ATP)
MNYLFIINPKSGDKKNRSDILTRIKKKFYDSHINYHIAYTAHPGEATHIAKRAVTEKYNVVIAVGGDGTVNEVASGLVSSSVYLGILPLGSGNGLARSLKIPLNIDDALTLLKNPKFISMDVGIVDDHLFFGVCGVGFDAMIGKQFQEFGPRGLIPYFIIGIRGYLGYRTKKFDLHADTQTVTVAPLLITVANTCQFGAGAVIAPSADFQDGMLDVCMIEKVPFFKAVCVLPLLFTGKIERSKYYTHFLCRSIEIVTEDDHGYLHTDGEPHPHKKRIKIGIKPAALKVCVSFQESGVRSRDEICL